MLSTVFIVITTLNDQPQHLEGCAGGTCSIVLFSVNIFSVPDSKNKYDQSIIADFVYDTIHADTNPHGIVARKFLAVWWARVLG